MKLNSLFQNISENPITKNVKKALKFTVRRFFMISLMLATVFCIFVWYRYAWKADWSEEKKQQYISEQAKFSFNKKGYQKTLDILNSRKDKFENFPAFSGRDLFFPDSW